MSRDIAYFLDILLMARDARDFVQGKTKNEFFADRQCQYAVVRCLEVIGEIAKRITPDTRLQHPDLPWSDMARMRDMRIHSYGKVDVDNVWDTVQRDIPTLIKYLEKILPPDDSK